MHVRARTHTHTHTRIVVQMLSCLILCDPMKRSTPGCPVLDCLLEFAQTHVHRAGDAIQPSHPCPHSEPQLPPQEILQDQ